MTSTIRLFLLIEVVAFGVAALTHLGFLFPGYAHHRASIAETLIAIVLLLGLLVSLGSPASIAAVGLWTQSFALFGTLVGLFTIAVGVGPRTRADIVYHVVIVIVLGCGLAVIFRNRRPSLTHVTRD